ncbi:MAG: hypothetical protein AAF916_08465, partial [Planctomycetota bacterium]
MPTDQVCRSVRRTRFSTRRLLPAACVGVAGLASVPASAGLDEALAQVSDDADFVMVIPSMQAASDAVADLTEMFGGDEPEMLDLLGSFKREMGFTAGLDDDGTAVIVITDMVEAIENDDEPTPLVLLPVSDYAAFVESIGGSGEGVSEVMLEGDEGFAKAVGDYALLGEDRAAVEAYAAGDTGPAMLERVGSYGQSGADDALIAGFIDVAAFRDALIAKIDEAIAEMAEDAADDLADEPDLPIQPESVSGLIESYGDLMKTVLQGVDTAMFSATFDDDGLRGGYAWNVVEGSRLSTYLTGERAGFQGLLDQMPASPYLAAFAIDTTAFDLGGLSTDLLDGVAVHIGDEPMFSGIVEMVRESLGLYEQMNAGAQVLYAPDMAAMMGGGMMKTLSVYDVDDTDAALTAWREGMARMPGMIPAMIEQLPEDTRAEFPAIDFTFDWGENALNLGGTDVHQYDLKFVLPPEAMAQMGPAAMMMGNAGTSGYIAAVNGKLVLTTVLDAQLMSQGIEAVKGGEGLGTSPVLQAARADLPANAVMEGYISLDGIANAANPFL